MAGHSSFSPHSLCKSEIPLSHVGQLCVRAVSRGASQVDTSGFESHFFNAILATLLGISSLFAQVSFFSFAIWD